MLLDERDENGLDVIFPARSLELALGVQGRPGLTELHFRSGKAVIIAAYPEAFRERWRVALAGPEPVARDAAEAWRGGVREAAAHAREASGLWPQPAAHEALCALANDLDGLAENGP